MISQILKILRKELNITQVDLADRLNISRSGYAHYESGDRKPSIDILIIIADFYNVSLDYLVGRTNMRNINNDKSNNNIC